MRIDVQGLPIAGQGFKVVIHDGVGTIRTVAAIDATVVFQSDCPDPPCHEMFMIPIDATGATLTVVTTDSVGNSAQQSFIVLGGTAGSTTPLVSGGGTTTMGA